MAEAKPAAIEAETSKSISSPFVTPLVDTRLADLESKVNRLIEVFRRSGMLHEFHMEQIEGTRPQLRSDVVS
jgi:hypothetical protein